MEKRKKNSNIVIDFTLDRGEHDKITFDLDQANKIIHRSTKTIEKNGSIYFEDYYHIVGDFDKLQIIKIQLKHDNRLELLTLKYNRYFKDKSGDYYIDYDIIEREVKIEKKESQKEEDSNSDSSHSIKSISEQYTKGNDYFDRSKDNNSFSISESEHAQNQSFTQVKDSSLVIAEQDTIVRNPEIENNSIHLKLSTPDSVSSSDSQDYYYHFFDEESKDDK